MFTKVPMKLNIPIIGWKDCKTAIISGPTTGTTRNSSTIQKHLPKSIQKNDHHPYGYLSIGIGPVFSAEAYVQHDQHEVPDIGTSAGYFQPPEPLPEDS